MSNAARWSLSTRFLRGLFFGLTLVVTVSVGISAWYLLRSTERELAALLVEELDEIDIAFSARRGEFDWEAIFSEFREHHPAQPIALRVWGPEGEGASDDPLVALGPIELLAVNGPAREPLGETLRASGKVRWQSRRLEDGRVVTIAIDGEPQYALLHSFGRMAALLIALTSLLALTGGVVFCRRMTRLLHTVADRARDVPALDQQLDAEIPGAPEEIREVAEALAELHANARREAHATKLLVAGLAHELRSPLQLLMGSTEVALLGKELPEDVRELLVRQLDELHEFGDTVHNLVSLCGPGRDTNETATEHFDFGEEIELRLARERELAARRDVRLLIERSGQLAIAGDREALLRAVRNLASNAVQWTESGGSVHVRLSGEDAAVRVVVDDQGPGVPPELRERIFEPFFRGPVSAGRRAGYGLGLALARTAAEAQGGRLEVGPAPGRGARFEMTLPRTARGPSASAARPA